MTKETQLKISEWVPIIIFLIVTLVAIGYYKARVDSMQSAVEKLEIDHMSDYNKLEDKVDKIIDLLIDR